MNKSLLFLVFGFIALIGIAFILMQRQEPVEQKGKAHETEKKQPPQKQMKQPEIISEKKLENIEPVKKNNEVKEVNINDGNKGVDKLESTKADSEKPAIASKVEKPGEATVKKPLFSFALNFVGFDENKLPENAEINLQVNEDQIKSKSIMNIARAKGEKFFLHLQDKKALEFDVRIPNFGYAKDIVIPYDKEQTINIQLTKGCQISGVITDGFGKSISNVEITLLLDVDTGFGISYLTPKSKGLNSDEKGYYQLNAIEPGRFKVQLKHDKYITLESWVNFSLNSEQVINFQMEEGAQIEGIIVDQKDNPVSEAIVKYKKNKKDSMFEMDFQGNKALEIKSDDKGQFLITGLESGSYLLTSEVKQLGHIRDFKVDFQKGEKKKSIKLILKNSLKIKGQVVDASGQALEGIILSASSGNQGFFGGRNSQHAATSEKNGQFQFDFLDDKVYTLSIESEKYRLTNATDLEIKAGNEEVVVAVKEMLELRGSVLLPNGQKAKDYELFLRYSQFDLKEPLKEVVISEGDFSVRPKVFSFGGKTTKLFLVGKSKGFAEGVSKQIEYTNDVNLIDDIIIQLKEESFEVFTVSAFDDKKITEIEYLATPVSKRLSGRDTLEKIAVDENKQIKIVGMKDVEYDLLFKLKGYANVLFKFKHQENSANQEIVFTKGSTIKGLAYETNGQASSFQKLNLKRTDILSISLMQHLNYTSQTNEKGEFVFENIPIGEYRLKKINPDKAFSPMDIFNISDGESIKIVKEQEINVNIGTKEEMLLQISGQVFLDDKVYDKGAIIYLSGGSGEIISKMNTSDSEGKFTITQIKRGKYSLVVGFGGVENEEMERFPIVVEENKENFFPINIYSEKVSGVINGSDGEKLNGSVVVFNGGFLSSQLNLFDAFTQSLYSSSFKNGQFSVKLPKSEAVDIYFAIAGKKYSSVYLQKVTKDELLKKNWIVTINTNITREVKVVDETGKKISNFDLDISDEKGIALITDMRGTEENWDAAKEEVYLPPHQDCTLFVSSPEFAVTKVLVTKNTTAPIIITLKAGFELTIIAKSQEGKTAELYDEYKKKYVRPASHGEMIMTHLGGGNVNAIKEGKKLFKNLMPGKYFVKINDEKGGGVLWSELIEITDKSVEFEFK